MPGALAVDAVHWTGNPMPPCFADAKSCGGHLLGSDENGRDLALRLIVGTWNTLAFALMTLAASVALGLFSGAFNRIFHRGGKSLGPLTLAFASFPAWPFAVVLLQAASMKRHDGVVPWYIMATILSLFVWPPIARAVQHSMRLVVPAALAALRNIVLLAATVDFLGYGVWPPQPSLGNILANAEGNFETAWWAFVFPTLAIAAIVALIEIVRLGWCAPLMPQGASTAQHDKGCT